MAKSCTKIEGLMLENSIKSMILFLKAQNILSEKLLVKYGL